MKSSLRLTASLLLASLAAAALAWIDTGHMVVSEIARRKLTPAVRAKVDALLKTGGDARTQDMLGAACWADDVKRDRRETASWHYSDQHFRLDGKPDTNKPDAENVVWAIAKFSPVLADKTKSDAERAEALRWLLHFVGDIHQPLHTVGRDSDEEPNGDKGGNDFKILSPVSMRDMSRPLNNLHALWDFGCGLYRGTERPLNADGLARIQGLATMIMKKCPESSVPESNSLDTAVWMAEGLKLSQDEVYCLIPGTIPSEAYMRRGQDICTRRLALAGYRLAHLLNQLLH